MHQVITPKILYFGTPVVLLSTLNEDGSANLAPMSSAWWLDQSCMLGLGTRSQTVENLRRDGQCVLNLPSADMVSAVDRLALTTGRNPVPAYKAKMGFRHEHHKFAVAGLTSVPSDLVRPPRVAECPVQLEAVIERFHPFGGPDDHAVAIEARIIRVHIDDGILNAEKRHHVDADKWKPLIMSFCEFYGLGEQLHPSRLAQVF
ncbi:MAG: flavin reductase family protein [Chloroflexales bacterium]|nr:flavin reductase family protein [Chloroflexales bacterium]